MINLKGTRGTCHLSPKILEIPVGNENLPREVPLFSKLDRNDHISFYACSGRPGNRQLPYRGDCTFLLLCFQAFCMRSFARRFFVDIFGENELCVFWKNLKYFLKKYPIKLNLVMYWKLAEPVPTKFRWNLFFFTCKSIFAHTKIFISALSLLFVMSCCETIMQLERSWHWTSTQFSFQGFHLLQHVCYNL